MGCLLLDDRAVRARTYGVGIVQLAPAGDDAFDVRGGLDPKRCPALFESASLSLPFARSDATAQRLSAGRALMTTKTAQDLQGTHCPQENHCIVGHVVVLDL